MTTDQLTLFEIATPAPPAPARQKPAFHLAWKTQDPTAPRPVIVTSPFLKQWRATHKNCKRGERCHVYKGLYFGNDHGTPAGLYMDFECLGCNEHYREGQS